MPSHTSAAAAAAPGSGGVVVTAHGNSFYVSNSDLNANRDQSSVETTLSPTNSEPRGGTSARKLVELAGFSPDALEDTDDAMTVSLRSESVRLSANEVKHGFGGDRRGSPRAATFDGEYNANEVRFLRPLREGESSAELIKGQPGTNLQVILKTNGERLDVGLIASDKTIDRGATVTFRVDPRPTGPATYQWDFEGTGQPVNGTQPNNSHVYATKGHFEARVTVTTEDGSSGTSAVFIDVGKTESEGPSHAPGSTKGPGRGGKAGGGKSRTGGGGKRREGPSSGPTSGRTTDSTAQRAGSGNSGGAGGAGGDTPQRDGGGTRKSPATHGPGIPVRGILLADQTAFKVPSALASAQSAVTRSAARAAAGSPGGLLGWFAGGTLVIAVLLSGAGLEFRMLTRRGPRS